MVKLGIICLNWIISSLLPDLISHLFPDPRQKQFLFNLFTPLETCLLSSNGALK